MTRNLFLLFLGLACLLFSLKAIALNHFNDFSGVLVTDWTRSYKLYGQPHALWLDSYRMVGANLGKLNQILMFAEHQKRRPEIVIYTLPFRDLGQSSEGGFATYEAYMADNQLLANRLQAFVAKTGIIPRIFLEPDSLAHAIQYRREMHDNPKSLQVYQDRLRVIPLLVKRYKQTGALVYLDAAHSGWFDYNDAEVQAIADVLNQAGIADADGIMTNVANRQKVSETMRGHAGNEADQTPSQTASQNEVHYLQRLLPRLHNNHLDVITDTSRNGGETHPRLYYLSPVSSNHAPGKHGGGFKILLWRGKVENERDLAEGDLIDNESPQGRCVGSWRTDAGGETWLIPFFGLPQRLSLLTSKDKYHYNPAQRILTAPPWLDPIGDVQPGPPPTDRTGLDVIQRFRYIKPPDDCDGSLNCPPGESKSIILQQTALFQNNFPRRDPDFWNQLLKPREQAK